MFYGTECFLVLVSFLLDFYDVKATVFTCKGIVEC